MKLKLLYSIPVFAILFGFSACSSEDITDGGQNAGQSGDAVIVNASIGANSVFTRSNPIGSKEEQGKFSVGDRIRINNGSKDADYVLSDDGETWRPATDSDVLTWEKDSMTFTAFYPANVKNEVEGFDNTFTYGSVQIGQMTKEGLAKSDYMTATKTVSKDPKDHTLSLTFERKTARVIVEIAGYNDQYNATDNPVVGVNLYGAVNTYGSPMGVKTYNVTTGGQPGAGNKFVALFFPTYAKPNREFITVYVEGEERPLRVTGIPKLEAGKSYTFKLVVGKDKADIQNVTVEDWANEDIIPGGAAIIRELNLNLDTDLVGTTLADWLNNNIGSNTKYTLNVSGTWNNDYFEPFRYFLNSRYKADLKLNLSAVTGMTEVTNSAFFGASGLSNIILPNTVKTIDNSAFNVSGLKNISLNEGVETIKEYAFYLAPIQELTLPASLVNTTQLAFALMQNLKVVRFKGDVKLLGGGIFDQDKALTDIYLDNCSGVPTLNELPFNWQSIQYERGEQATINVWVKDANMKAMFEADENWKALSFLHITYAGEPKTE